MPEKKYGFSVIEVLIAIVIVVSGFSAILTLQVKTLNSVSDTINITDAINLAEHFIESVKIESLQWQNDSTLSLDQNQFKYLKYADTGWRAAYLKNGSSTMVGKNGNDNNISDGYDTGLLQEITLFPEKFCVFYRLTSLISNEALRLEVRVLYRKSYGVWNDNYTSCQVSSMVQMIHDIRNVGMVNLVTVISKNRVGQ